MGEPIKKEPEITNTLFRFTSLRSPQKLDDETKELTFIKMPEESILTSPFYQGVINRDPSVSKKKALTTVASSFTSVFSNESAIKSAYPELYAFAQWIIKNRGCYTKQKLLEEANKVTATLSTRNQEEVWNDLFYQLITQQSFDIKEALMQLLVADHVAKYVKSNPGQPAIGKEAAPDHDRVINASVMLPAQLFGEYTKGDVLTPAVEVPGTLYPAKPDKRTKKRLAITEAKFRIEKYGILKKELEKSEEKYRKEYTAEYNKALATHNTIVKPIMDKYSSDLEVERQAYATHRETNNSLLPYDPKNPYDRAKLVPAPDVPVFSFTHEPEVSATRMQAELSGASYADLVEVLHNSNNPNAKSIQQVDPANAASVFEGYDTYQNVYNVLSTAKSAAQGQISQNTSIIPNKVTYGGVTIPVVARGSQMSDFGFKMCAYSSLRRNIFSLELEIPNESWEISKVKVTTTLVDTVTTENISDMEGILSNGSTLRLDRFYVYETPFNLGDDSPILDFEITFTNGYKKTISNVDGLLKSCVTGTATGASPAPDPVRNTTSQPFIPATFGFTNIGVADYKRVDQTVQCYIEGEVSHIENIMAREYKERATRKLRRSEETNTTSSETEQEQLTDTTTTDRFEMQSEVDQAIQESKDKSGFVSTGYTYESESAGTFRLDAGLSFANNSSKQNSIRQSRTEAQEITERALDRVVKKVKEERVRKVIEEFEENNKHGFDNRQGSQHVVGVYRWIDKLYKNQIVNYGKRMMLEFMIPDPSRLHVLGLTDIVESGDSNDDEILMPPPDPRTIGGDLSLQHYGWINDTTVQHWSGYYNVEIEPKPAESIAVGAAFDVKNQEKTGKGAATGGNGKVTIPEGYKSKKASAIFNAAGGGGIPATIDVRVGGVGSGVSEGNNGDDSFWGEESFTGLMINNPGFRNEVPVSYLLASYTAGQVNVTVECELTDEGRDAWKQKTFNAIIDAYEEALAEYNDKVKGQVQVVEEKKKTNPGFYRQIENKILRKNCISYLLDQNPEADFTYGKSMSNGGTTFEDYEITPNQELANYASFVKFMEQAFEWDIMSYNFYSYYWGDRSKWSDLYKFDDSNDPVFRSFMQAGMARVVLTVRPGFEEAVNLYLSTGILWNGGQVPVVGDELYVSLVEELKPAVPEKECKPWLTRVPTSLTILQADSIGLKVEKALPCNCEDKDEFENPEEIPCGSNFEISDSQLGSDQKNQIQFTFQRMDNLFNKLDESNPVIQYFDDNGYFPRIYECMGQEIIIERDASWETWDNLSIIYGQLAERLSLIAGVTAEVIPYYEENDKLYPDAIRFTIDTDIIPEFMFIKKDNHGAWDPNFDMLRVVANNSTVRVIHDNHYLSERILDKEGTFIQDSEQNTLLPIDRFDYE